MSDFMIRFLICNVFLDIIIGCLVIFRHLFRNHLTSRAQYHLWFLLLGLLAVPFIPLRSVRFSRIFSRLAFFQNFSVSYTGNAARERMTVDPTGNMDWLNDFTLSVSSGTSSITGNILLGIWIAGILVMVVFLAKAFLRLQNLKQSALPLQHPKIRRLYHQCLHEMKITKNIPIYSTAFLKSPVISGLWKPCIYLPIHLISDYKENYKENDIKYMLMHELAHYKHKDALANYFMNIIGVLYWFNPFVWYALKEMKNDRETACDTSVLKLLDEDAYKDYGNTLIQFAEKVSLTSFPFAAGISGSMKQMQKRILNIANYHPVSFRKTLRSAVSFTIIAFFLIGTAPLLSIQATENDCCYFDEANRNITYIDLNDMFEGYHGSFVLYDAAGDSWQIYHKEYATAHISPASTFKIYSALFGLESGMISPEQSLIPWDGQHYTYDSWNADQTLESAMQNSVTWYFQALDRQTGLSAIKEYIQKIGYGSQTVEGDISSYWINSSLKISPVEQVELLEKFYYNRFGFAEENIEAVKSSIRLYSTEEGTLSGKTGTKEVNGLNTSGWFIGYVEKDNRTYFFATNIQSENLASGSVATELTFSILSDLNLWDIG